MNATLLRRALLITLMFALPLACAWSLVLWLLPEHPKLQRLLGIGIYGLALVAAVLVGRRLRRSEGKR